MITKADLKTQSKSELGRLAKGLGVSDWQNMRKEDLVALLAKKKISPESNKSTTSKKSGSVSKKVIGTKKAVPSKSSNVPKVGTSSKSASNAKVTVPQKSATAQKPAAKKAESKLVGKDVSPKNPVAKSAGRNVDVKSGGSKAVSKQLSPVSSKRASTKVDVEVTGKSNPQRSSGGTDKNSSKKITPRIVVDAKGESKKDAESKVVAKKEATTPVAKGQASKPVNKPQAAAVSPGDVKRKSPLESKPVKTKPIAKKHVSTTDVKILEHLRKLQEQRDQQKDLAQPPMRLADPATFAEKLPIKPEEKDRIVLIVKDPFWLQASWDVSRRAIERARASMAEHWHTAKPTLRLLAIGGSGSTNAAETIDRDIEVHGGVRNWYIEIKNPPGTFRILLGYLAANGRFHELSRSNIVVTPAPGSADAVDGNWADIAHDCEHIFALSGGYNAEHESKELQEMFEDRLKRPMGTPALTQFGSGAEAPMKRKREFQFDIDAEMILFGATQVDAYVTLGGEPVKIREDGSFSVRLPLPDRRQVLPAVASSRDGSEQRTIVIAVERNTKVMEPLSKENEE